MEEKEERLEKNANLVAMAVNELVLQYKFK
jgi:hypothetical protein